jgi:cell wall-associated NlpC family hydrolase
MNLCKSLCFFLSIVLLFSTAAFSQEMQRPRVIPDPQTETRSTNPPSNIPTQNPRTPTLTNKIVVVQPPAPLVKKTASSQPVNPAPTTSSVKAYNPVFNQRLFSAIQNRLGIPYRYGSNGPNSYDCSGLVWSVFQDAGFYFERSSARTLWQNSFAVEGDDRYKFGTLVFFNGLGHIGIVVSDKGFYHASSSKGVTYSSFDGYWSKRIVGFRRLSIE